MRWYPHASVPKIRNELYWRDGAEITNTGLIEFLIWSGKLAPRLCGFNPTRLVKPFFSAAVPQDTRDSYHHYHAHSAQNTPPTVPFDTPFVVRNHLPHPIISAIQRPSGSKLILQFRHGKNIGYKSRNDGNGNVRPLIILGP